LKKDILFSKVIDSKDSKRTIDRHSQVHIDDILKFSETSPGQLQGLQVDEMFRQLAEKAHEEGWIKSVTAKDELLRPDEEVKLAEEKKKTIEKRTIQTVLDDFRATPRRAAANNARDKIARIANAQLSQQPQQQVTVTPSLQSPSPAPAERSDTPAD
jgi:hypothetical protein